MLKIDFAKKEDIDQIYDLGKGVDEFQVADNIINFWPKPLLCNMLRREDVFVLVARMDEKMVGFLIVNYNKTLQKAIIENIYVREEYRRNAVGKNMMEKVILFLQRQNCKTICALAGKEVEFYKYCGFYAGNNFTWMDYTIGNEYKLI